MYRNNQIRDFKSILKHQQSTGTKSKENIENDNKLPENIEQTSVRSTTKILHLLKRTEKSCTTRQKENDVIITNKDKDNVSNVENSATPVEKMFVYQC